MVGEEIECSPAREPAHQLAIVALVEEGSGLLSGARRRAVADLALPHLDRLRHRPHRIGDLERQPLVPADRGVVFQQYSPGSEHLIDRRDHIVAHRFESGGE